MGVEFETDIMQAMDATEVYRKIKTMVAQQRIQILNQDN